MWLKLQVRFLEEGERVIALPYSALRRVSRCVPEVGVGAWYGVLWGGLNNLIQEKNEEEYVMIEVRPEIYG
jgi:hypothetical protein